MSRWQITFIDGTTESGTAVGTPDQVYPYIAEGQRGMARLEVRSMDDAAWPEADEAPVHY